MKKILLLLIAHFAFTSTLVFAQKEESDTLIAYYEKIEKSLKYQEGKIDFPTGNAVLNVPEGFKFLDAKQTQYVLHDLWGNPEDTTVLGALVPNNRGVTYSDSWIFVITYSEEGYVKDDDAQEIDYDEILKEMKEDTRLANEERKKQGYESAELVGWASKPFYDENLKVLHWAKEIKFGDSPTNTLNYDLRVLGRKGMFNISAVAGMAELGEVKKAIPGIIKSVHYNSGSKYSDFDESTDNVAAWTLGGLVAGKVLAKAGFFAVLLKFGKFIIIGIAAAAAAIRKFFFGNKDQVLSRKQEEASPPHDETENT